MKASDFLIRQPQHLLVYGDPKTYKSRIVMELASAGYKLKYFSIDQGIPLKGQSQKALDNVEVFNVRDTSSFQVGIKTCRQVIKGTEFNLCDYHGHISCPNCATAGQSFSRVCLNEMGLDEIAVFDHLTAMSLSALNCVWKGEVYANSDVPADDTTSYNIWRQQGWLLTDFMNRVQQSPFNVICIAQEAMTKFEDGSKKICPDIGTGNLSATSPSFFDHIIHCDKANDKFKFTSIKNMAAIVGSRDGIAIEDMKTPSLAPFMPELGVAREKVVVVSDGKIIKPNIITISTSESKSSSSSSALEAMRAKLNAKKG